MESIDVQPRIVTEMSEVIGLWAAHESGKEEEFVSGVFPRGLLNGRSDMIGTPEAEQAHAYVASMRTYGRSYPVLWWSAFIGPVFGFDARAYFRSCRRQFCPSHEAGMGMLGYGGRLPCRVLELFLGCVERRLELEPLELWPRVEAPCEADVVAAIVRDVSARVDAKYKQGPRRF